MAQRSRELGLGYWEADFAYQALQLEFHAGRYHGLLDEIADLAALPLDPRSRDALTEVQCLALVDVGRPDEAAALAEVAKERAAADSGGAVHFWWALAEAALASGQPQRALECAEAYLAGLPEGNPNDAFGWVTRAWAQLELGLEPTSNMPPTDRPMLFAVPHELAGVTAAHDGRYDDAARELAEAAPLWAPYHRRGELRCAWAAGEMLRRGGRTDEAVEALTLGEATATDIGLTAVLHRTQRSLRLAGERRASARSTGPVGLTGREQAVLALVAQGLTNEQVATRLGVTRRTVVTQIGSAMTKLGAENRLQAAVLAARLDAGGDA
jgi:DNA-binding CsgD family transcriptional regulator